MEEEDLDSEWSSRKAQFFNVSSLNLHILQGTIAACNLLSAFRDQAKSETACSSSDGMGDRIIKCTSAACADDLLPILVLELSSRELSLQLFVFYRMGTEKD